MSEPRPAYLASHLSIFIAAHAAKDRRQLTDDDLTLLENAARALAIADGDLLVLRGRVVQAEYAAERAQRRLACVTMTNLGTAATEHAKAIAYDLMTVALLQPLPDDRLERELQHLMNAHREQVRPAPTDPFEL